MGTWTSNGSAFTSGVFGGLGGMAQEAVQRSRAQQAQQGAREQQHQFFQQAFHQAQAGASLRRRRHLLMMANQAKPVEVLGVGEGSDHPEVPESRCELI